MSNVLLQEIRFGSVALPEVALVAESLQIAGHRQTAERVRNHAVYLECNPISRRATAGAAASAIPLKSPESQGERDGTQSTYMSPLRRPPS